jgi:hypothetical protein
VKKREDYLKQAKECRSLAKQMESGAQRDQLLKMAETWEVLASERERRERHTPDEAPPSGKKSNGAP